MAGLISAEINHILKTLTATEFGRSLFRNTIIESKGKWDDAKFAKNREVMANLWNEIAELADFNKVENQNSEDQH